MDYCKNCGKQLSADEIGASKKLINRGLTEFFCLDCLAEMFRVSRKMLLDKIEFFRASGCTLFVPSDCSCKVDSGDKTGD